MSSQSSDITLKVRYGETLHAIVQYGETLHATVRLACTIQIKIQVRNTKIFMARYTHSRHNTGLSRQSHIKESHTDQK